MTVKLLKGDCLKLMGGVKPHSIDLILADLPCGTTRNNKWDNVLPFNELWENYKRILKPGGAIALFGDEPFASKLRMSNKRWYRYDWYWLKNQGTGFLNAHKMPLKAVETISVFYPKLPLYNPQMRTGFNAYKSKTGSKSTNYGEFKSIEQQYGNVRYPLNYLSFKKVSKTVHPTQKPIDLLEYLIKTYTNEGMTVLDNTMGSGSTGVAAVNTNRNFIGMEMNDKYFAIAKQRIEKAENNVSLLY